MFSFVYVVGSGYIPARFVLAWTAVYFALFKQLLIVNCLELYEYCLENKLADATLIAKWKKQGYENLCCLRCIQSRDTNFGTNCICRVPKSKLDAVR